MLRALPSRRIAGLAIAITAGTGIGFGAYTLGSAAGANSSHLPRVAAATTSSGSDVPGAPSTSSPTSPSAPATPAEAPATPLTLEEAQAIALEVAPGGRIVEWDEDNEPTGLRYDVTVLHDDGSTTEVEVDTVTGMVTSINHDNDWD